MADIAILVKKLINTKRLVDSKVPIFGAQGQAMDGYTELAVYRAIIADLEAVGGASLPAKGTE